MGTIYSHNLFPWGQRDGSTKAILACNDSNQSCWSTTKFCSCHDSTAVVACAKFYCEYTSGIVSIGQYLLWNFKFGCNDSWWNTPKDSPLLKERAVTQVIALGGKFCYKLYKYRCIFYKKSPMHCTGYFGYWQLPQRECVSRKQYVILFQETIIAFIR